MSFKDASGNTISDKRKYLTGWRKQADGSWKVLYDMCNTDLPASTELQLFLLQPGHLRSYLRRW
jgi:hypothetical protein